MQIVNTNRIDHHCKHAADGAEWEIRIFNRHEFNNMTSLVY